MKHVIERKIKRGEDDEEDVSSYWITLRKLEDSWNLKEALDRTRQRTGLGRGCELVVRQAAY